MSRSTLVPLVGSLAMVAAFAACGGPEYPNCNNDEDCHEGEFCVNGTCQQCVGDENCEAGERCVGGACEPIPGYCETTNDCPTGQECTNNRCTEVVVEREPPPPPPPQECQLASVYFAFDSSELSQQARDALEQNLSCMGERDVESIRLNGHCDPRGTEEYNLALGDRRARSVQSHMRRLGVDRRNMATHSYGEEQARGYNEETWRTDRRVETQPQ
ncbi:MAG: OmpA family protein [Sandaracinaceae bacterium]